VADLLAGAAQTLDATTNHDRTIIYDTPDGSSTPAAS